MNSARIIVLIIALAAGGVAAYLVSGSDRPAPAAPVAEVPTADVLVAKSEIVLPNVRVLAIDQAPKEKDGQNNVIGKTVTLELRPEQAETLARSRQTGTLTLALRSIADLKSVEASADNQVITVYRGTDRQIYACTPVCLTR